MQQDTESCLENTHFVKSHLKDTKELESFPQVPQGRVRSSRWPSLVSLLGTGGRRSTSHPQGHFGHIQQMMKMPFPGLESPYPKLSMKRPQGQRHRSRGVRVEVRTEAEAISKQPAMGETSEHLKVNQMKH